MADRSGMPDGGNNQEDYINFNLDDFSFLDGVDFSVDDINQMIDATAPYTATIQTHGGTNHFHMNPQNNYHQTSNRVGDEGRNQRTAAGQQFATPSLSDDQHPTSGIPQASNLAMSTQAHGYGGSQNAGFGGPSSRHFNNRATDSFDDHRSGEYLAFNQFTIADDYTSPNSGMPSDSQHSSDRVYRVDSTFSHESPAMQSASDFLSSMRADAADANEQAEELDVPMLNDEANVEEIEDDQNAPPPPQDGPQAYTSDITDPDNARYVMAHPSLTPFTKLEFENDRGVDVDDLDVVKNQMHAYAKRFYDALQATGKVDLTGRIDHHEVEFAKDVKGHFGKQQTNAIIKIKDLMATPQQLLNSRANCVLAFEAAIFIHETGVPTEIIEEIQKHPNSTSAKYPHVNRAMICSKRLEKMIETVTQYKLIALDVLQGNNLKKLAHDPEYYATEKADFLISNRRRAFTMATKRAANVTKMAAADVKMAGAEEMNQTPEKKLKYDDGTA